MAKGAVRKKEKMVLLFLGGGCRRQSGTKGICEYRNQEVHCKD